MQQVAPLAQAREAVLEHRLDEPFLGAEVVLHRRVVAVARRPRRSVGARRPRCRARRRAARRRGRSAPWSTGRSPHMGGSHHPGQRKSIVLEFRRSVNWLVGGTCVEMAANTASNTGADADRGRLRPHQHDHAPGLRRGPGGGARRPGARWCGPRTTGATGSSAPTTSWPPRSATGRRSRRSGPIPAARRSRSPTAASRPASPRRATRRTGTATAARSPSSSRRRRRSGCAVVPGIWTAAPPRPGRRDGRDRVRPRPHHRGAGARSRSSGSDTRRRSGRWFADTFHGISAYPAGSPEHHEASQAYGPVLARIKEELHDRIVSPRDDALTAIAHHEVDGERLSEDAAQSIAFLTTVGGIDTTTALGRRRAAPPLEVPGRSAAADRRTRRCSRSPPRSSCASIRRRARTSASSRSTPSSAASP